MPTYIERAYIAITSDETPPDVLTARLGVEPTSTRDSVKNPRPNGIKPAHPYSWHLESDSPSDEVGDHIEALRPALERLAEVELLPAETRNFTVYGFARGMGYWFGFEPEQAALLSAAGCGVGIDVYNTPKADDVELTPEFEAKMLSKIPRSTTQGGLVIREPVPAEYDEVLALVARSRELEVQPDLMYMPSLSDQLRDPWVSLLVAEDTAGELAGFAHVSLSRDILYSSTRAHVNVIAASDANDGDCIRGLLGECAAWAARAGATDLTVPTEWLPFLPADAVVKPDLTRGTVSLSPPGSPWTLVRLG
jgi:hypothetical protein